MKFRILSISAILVSLLAGCSSIDGDQVSVESAQAVNDQMTIKRDAITNSLDLQTESYWTKCEDVWEGVGYRYRSSFYQSGNQHTQLYIRLKSSQGAFGINKAFDDNGENYTVDVYQPEVKSDSVVHENFAVNFTTEQLEKASKGPLVMHLKGEKNDCTFTVDQPVSYAFYLNFVELNKQVQEQLEHH
ncbi:MAG: hypothetical protein ACK5NC_16645 [Vibrio sp.]